MKYFRLGLCMAAMSFAAFAESPFTGVWEQNHEKSLTSPAGELRTSGLRIEAAGENRIRITHLFVAKDGGPVTSTGVFVLDGSDAPLTGKAALPGYTQAFRPVGKNVWERVQKVNGEIRARGYWAVSNDGTTLVMTSFGTNAKGQEHYLHRVLNRRR